MENDPNKKLNEMGKIQTTQEVEDERGLKKYYNKLNVYVERSILFLYNLLTQPFSKFFFVIVITVLDAIVFYYYGAANGFRALVSEGTLALAFVTYLQMKKGENNIVN
ncbi:hypothetical protein ACNF40_06690 [Cuniculiplasma sp. SKW4]|uniref:hypothetical protein n=1 Tax=Cuniculiplasma sp. SKW4 TaxID=3400171 RepID=UPI003FD68BD5